MDKSPDGIKMDAACNDLKPSSDYQQAKKPKPNTKNEVHDAMDVYSFPSPSPDGVKNKRKRVSLQVTSQNKDSIVADRQKELDDLFEYYRDVSGIKISVDNVSYSNDSIIACLLEESCLSFCKLAEDICEKMQSREGITLAVVRNTIISVGQRTMYGIANMNADILEDESPNCLWCWETREKEMKLLPPTQCRSLNIRRTARRKIHERITALTEYLSALSAPEHLESYTSDLSQATAKLQKTLSRARIHTLFEQLKEKNDVHMAGKDCRLMEKELIKESEKNMRIAEKERKRKDRELLKEKLQHEKEIKLRQEETEKDERRREKEETELKRQLKKQQEEAEKEQKRREKEGIMMKKQISIQKQASIMDRFLKSCTKDNKLDDPTSSDARPPISEPFCAKKVVDATVSSMDLALSQGNIGVEDLRKIHISSWHNISCCNKFHRWGTRSNPKSKLINDLKLQTNVNEEPMFSDVMVIPKQTCDKSLEDCEPSVADDISYGSYCNAELAHPLLKRKLLQFDKSHRPAYYGTWRKRSTTVGSRHPFVKDPNIDYDIDSDEEWAEEDPGESLSDCDKEDTECLEEQETKQEDDDDSEDGFVVSDGYLSDNEGAQVESPSDGTEDEVRSLSFCKVDTENEEFRTLLQHQKHLNRLTDLALQKSQPLIICNLMHDKAEMAAADLISVPLKNESICLQALMMRACSGGLVIDTFCGQSDEDQEDCRSQRKTIGTPMATSAVIPDSDLPEFVASIQLNSHGINKIIDSLQQKFPSTLKSQLKSKVREISDFVDNHWQVKKQVLASMGSSPSPVKCGKPKGITAFFSKPCLPPGTSSETL